MYRRKFGSNQRICPTSPSHQRRKAKVVTASRPVEVARETATKSTKRIVPNNLQLGASWDIILCKDGARPAFTCRHSGLTKVPVYSRALQAATMPLWVQIPESLPTKVCPPIYLWLIKLNPCIPVSSLKLRRKTVRVSAIPVIV